MSFLRFSFLGLFLLLATTVSAQQIVFEKTYGSNGEEYGKGIVQLPDSSYVIVGSSSSFGTSADVLLMKVDSAGGVIWNKTRGGFNIDSGEEIIVTSDGMLAMVGYTNSFGAGGYDVYFLKSDFDGNIVLAKTYGGSDWDLGYALTETSDGGFAITGQTYSAGAGKSDAFILKVNAQGDSLWSQEFGGAEDEIGYSIIETMNGDLMISGETASFGAGKKDGWIVRTNPMGTEIWNQTFGGAENDFSKEVIQLTTGNFMLVNSTESLGAGSYDMQLTKFDGNGNTLLNAVVGGPQADYAEGLIQYTRKSGVVVMGSSESYGFDASDMFYFGADTSGISYTPGCTGGSFGEVGNDYGLDAVAALDSGFVLCGSRTLGTGYTSVFLVKLDINCTSAGSVTDEQLVAGVEELERTIELYPNPTQDRITLASETPINEVVLYDLAGKQLGTMPFNGFNIDVSLRQLGAEQAGMYILELWTDLGRVRKKVLVD